MANPHAAPPELGVIWGQRPAINMALLTELVVTWSRFEGLISGHARNV
jgi:hypothetical protein